MRIEYGSTALSSAIHCHDCDSVKQFLLCGSDLGHRDFNGQMPLRLTVSLDDVAVMQLLLAAKADVNSRDMEGATALHMTSVKPKGTVSMEPLLSNGASVESKDNKGFRPLHGAVYYNVPSNLQLLMRRGAKMNATSEDGTTTLMLGAMENTHETLRFSLREEALEFDGKNSKGRSVLGLAALYGDLETLYILQSSRQIDEGHFGLRRGPEVCHVAKRPR